MTVHVLGIRHHGPGSARSLIAALERLQPDCLLVEGPSDADDVLSFVLHDELVPPVALLVHDEKQPGHASFYPFARFSPEWQALRYGVRQGIPTRFMDLPHARRAGPAADSDDDSEDADTEAENDEEAAADAEDETEAVVDSFDLRTDPLSELARAAGHGGGEAWWEHIVEHRRDALDVFEAVGEAMTAVRSELAPGSLGRSPDEPTTEAGLAEARREAWMRRTLRAAVKDGFERIAVVCGAWHVPALLAPPQIKWDNARLKGLPRRKVAATWVPWTHDRLARASGYGAGVTSPGWYDHLWTAEDAVGARWLGRVARHLRDAGIDASSAHVVEALRLAEATAAIRELATPGLDEYTEAVESILLGGDPTPLALIRRKVHVGEELGRVPEDAPAVPLRQDLASQQKSLRIKPSAVEKTYDLDLRRGIDLSRSHLWHRLALLDIPWARRAEGRGGTGTFHEYWDVAWSPECEIAIVDAARWGNTVESAATARVEADAAVADLPRLAELIDEVLFADLGDAATLVLSRLEATAAVATDVHALLRALTPLARTLRYGSVRDLASDALTAVVHGITTRAAIGLPAACRSLDDDAADRMVGDIRAAHAALAVLGDVVPIDAWYAALEKVAERDDDHGLLVGALDRLLLDAGRIEADDAALRLQRALSRAVEASDAAARIEGFLRGSGALLVHDARLRGIVDDWLTNVPGERFEEVLPLLRRTVSRFPAPERRRIGEALAGAGAAEDVVPLDTTRADRVLPVVHLILGLSTGEEASR